MEDRYDIGVDVGEGSDMSCLVERVSCWGGKSFVDHDDTHDKVYGLNKQMCDIDKHLSEAGYFGMICDGQVEAIKKLKDMKEKKTKKMTKAEAFEYLKGKKIICYAGIANIFDEPTKVEKLLLEIGCRYHFANHIGWRGWYWPLYGFIVDSKGEIYIAFEDQMDFFKQNLNEPISVDDILSIEIVEDGLSYDKVVELAKPLMHYLNEVGCRDSIRVSQLSIVHEPMSTLIFDNGIGE